MRLGAVLGLFLVTILGTSAVYGSEAQSICDRLQFAKNSTVGWAVQVTEKLCSLPRWTPYRNGIINWATMFNPLEYADETALISENRGLNGYFQDQLSREPLFYEQMKIFIAKVQEYTNDKFDGKLNLGAAVPNPRLSDRAGMGKYQNVEPGWLWKIALQVTNQNSRQALRLIAACGHDDVRTPYNVLKHAEDRVRYSESRRNLQRQQHELSRNFTQGRISAEEYVQMFREIDNNRFNISHLTADRYETIDCPSYTYFVSGGLGEGVDIPDSLKEKIARIQAPTKGASVLPSKHYHVLLGAFSTCELMHNGLPASAAIAFQENFAWAYRSMAFESRFRLLSNYLRGNDIESYEAKYGLIRTEADYQRFLTFLESKLRAVLVAQFTSSNIQDELIRSQEDVRSNAQLSEEQRAEILRSVEERYEGYKKDQDLAIEKGTQSLLALYDAFSLYRQWVQPWSLMGIRFGYTDRIAGPSTLDSITLSDRRYIPRGWSNARYLAAKEKINTWLVDFEWTVAQHRAGAQFAARVCK